MHRETLSEVRDGSGDPPGCPGWVRGPSERSGTGWGTLQEVQNRLGGPPEGLGLVGRPSRTSGTGWGTHLEVRDGSGNSPKGPGRVGGLSRKLEQVGRSSGRSVTSREVLQGVCDRSRDPFRGLG